MKQKKKIILFLSITTYVFSLTQDSFCTITEPCYDSFGGLMSLLSGPFGILILHLPAFTWLANPLLFFSWFKFFKNSKVSMYLSIISLLIMLSFLLVDKIIYNEAGISSKITSYGLGYYLWVLSSITMVIGNSFILRKNSK